MPITAECTSCGKQFQAPDAFVGRRVKCKNCGTVFQIAASQEGDSGDTDLDALEAIERSASGIEPPQKSSQRSQSGTVAGRIRARDDIHLPGNPGADEFDLKTPLGDTHRANVMYFRYPGAVAVDQWLPLVLLVGGFGLFGLIASGQDVQNVPWIAALRFFLPVLFFYILIFPLTLAGLRKASAELNYRPPPNPKLRAFAIYTPAFALGAGLWLAGDGMVMALALGTFVGLLLSSAALWLLYRLKDNELAMSVAYGAGGYLVGLALTVGLFFGLNLLTAMIVTRSHAETKVPASPFGPGLAWVSPPPEEPKFVKPIAPPTAVAVVPAPVAPEFTSTSPAVAAVAQDKLPAEAGPISDVIYPLSGGNVVAIVHVSEKTTSVDAWNTESWKQMGSGLSVPSTIKQFALSPDGKQLAYVDKFPRLSVKLWSFEDGNLIRRIDLNAANGEPQLIGFAVDNHLIVHWTASGDAEAKVKPWHIEVLDCLTRKRITEFTTPPLENTPAVATIGLANQRMAVATKQNGTPSLMQFSLEADVTAPPPITIAEIDPAIAVAPTGLAYSADGTRLTVLFEYGGGGVMPVYDCNTGSEVHDNEFTAWPPSGVTTAGFNDNAIEPLPGRAGMLLYGQAILDTMHGKTVGSLGINGVIAQHIAGAKNVQLLVTHNAAKRIVGLTLDESKLNSLLPATSQPATPTSAPAKTSVFEGG